MLFIAPPLKHLSATKARVGGQFLSGTGFADARFSDESDETASTGKGIL